MDRQPKPGEWWFSPDGEERAFYVGVDGDGDLLWEIIPNEFSSQISPSYVPVPDCTGWDWQLPAMPIGWELCGPPTEAVESTFLRVWLDHSWLQCCAGYIDDDAYTYCRRKPSAVGSQKEPASLTRIAAQLRQVLMDLEELEVSDVDHDTQKYS